MQKTKWIQFRLRTFLLVVFVVGAIGGWLANANAEFRRELAAIDKLFEHESARVSVTNNRDGSETHQNVSGILW